MKQDYVTPILEICWIFDDIVMTSVDGDIDGVGNFAEAWVQ